MDILSNNTNINTTNNISLSPLAERSDAETIQEKTEKENILNIKKRVENDLENVRNTCNKAIRQVKQSIMIKQDAIRMDYCYT
jgi:hypothetical protein